MKRLLFVLALALGAQSWGQVDTVFLSQEKLADTIYNGLYTKVPTGYLANKLSLLPSDSLLLKTNSYIGDKSKKFSDADKMMQWLYEMNQISISNNLLPKMDTIFNEAYTYVGEMEFDNEIIVIPLGIFNLKFNSIDEERGLNNGVIGRNGSIFTDLKPNDSSIVSELQSNFAGPLFDYVSSEQMGLVVRKDFFISNTKSINDVANLKLYRGDVWKEIDFDEILLFTPYNDSIQQFKFQITYIDSTIQIFHFLIHTPESYNNANEKELFDPEEWDDDPDEYLSTCSALGTPWSPGCKSCGMIPDDQGNKIKWCFIPSCSREGYDDEQPEKPYILVTGYRPPMFGQSFKKTWKIYNDEHHNLLNDLRNNDYDVIIVKFNIAAKPNKHGMVESANLFEKFLLHLNLNMKKGGYFENIIQGSSMGEEIVRLTLLRMEKKHLVIGDNYPHHHSRLNIAYDANFYGANIPLGYQYQIYSAHYYKTNYFGAINYFLSSFLYATINQKTFKELVAYHAASYNDNIFSYPNQVIGYTVPNHHWRRQGYLNALSDVDNGVHIFPMPVAPRNIAISLGKISGKNSDNNEKFNNAGEYWQNISILGWKFRVGTAKYMPPGQTFQIFKRQIPPVFFNPFLSSCKHEVNVSQMLEIDNVSGSYMTGIGNFIAVSDWTYFPLTQLWNGRAFYSHKSVVTALGINPNVWPTDGSMSVNVQDLGLMYEKRTISGLLIGSNHFGYPNLGRPNDHFQITPFEAIYIDDKINPHIKLKDDDPSYLDSLNGFILNEAEPWYLKLQNQEVGENARADYTYYVHRRARNWITIGHLVTPATDPGDYVTLENALVDLRAGEEIQLKPGVHFKPGSNVHLKIAYDDCPQESGLKTISSKNQNSRALNKTEDDRIMEIITEKQVVLYPNPSETGRFTIKSESITPITSVKVYSLYGQLLLNIEGLEAKEYKTEKNLPAGTYVIDVLIGNKKETFKLIVL